MGASCIVIKGGFEGLGDPELDEEYITQKSRREPFPELTRQHEKLSRDFSVTLTRLNPEVYAVPEPYPAEGSYAKPSTERSATSGYPFWPRQTPADNLPTLPESNSEPVPTNKDNNKKVRIKGYAEVKEITEEGLKINSADILNVGPKQKLQSACKKEYAYDDSSPLK